ncbi:MAG: outer membrane protein assembly factor BamC [Burkholderiales bacterium]|nr:outer membrane protein assembly factor BamC [Burkholderiales bacterium]
MSGDKLDYRSQAGKTTPLEVPPDLTQLARDGRYLPQSGSVSASAMQAGSAGSAAPTTTPVVAPSSLGEFRVERQGNQRWLASTLPPEQIWPQVRSFWLERGFSLTLDNPQIGLLETDWAENRAKLPQDFIRGMIGRVFNSMFDTGERDKFRTRIERVGTGSEVFITHRGMVEVYNSDRKETTAWQPRPADRELEAEFLSRLMVRLGAKEEVARAAVATPSVPAVAAGPARARLLAGQPGAAMEVDEAFDRAWRRVGLALDRGGFTVEDRDRSAGLYYVRYVDPKLAGQEEPGFFSKLFGGDKGQATLQRYRLTVKAAGGKTLVSVLNNQGEADNGEAAKVIVSRLVDELK